MARGNSVEIETNFTKEIAEQVHEKSNSCIEKDVNNSEDAHYVENPSTNNICLQEIPAKKPKQFRKRKASTSNNHYANESEFNSENSDECGEIDDGVWDQGMPDITSRAETNNSILNNTGISLSNYCRSTPLTMSEYIRRSTFMRFTANERKLLERTFRGYLISQLDDKFDEYEGNALNDEDVKQRLNSFERLPMSQCLACERGGRSGPCPPKSPSEIFTELTKIDGRRKKHIESRPHMKYATLLADPLGVQMRFCNPLFRKAVARLPDLRLLGHNASKLVPIVLPKKKRISRQPVAIHLCDELYGTFEYATRKEKIDSYSKFVRPLICCRTLYSTESFKHQSKILQRRIENCVGHFYKFQRKRSLSESPPYSKVGAISPFGAFRVRTSRSVSPNRRRHPEIEQAIAFRSPYKCHGETIDKFNGRKAPLKAQKFMLCLKSNGSYGAFFYFEKTENSILMPTRPRKPGTCRFRKMHFENESNLFIVFEFTVIETEMFEYLAKLRFINADNRCIELRPEAKFGAVLPRRMVFNYLRQIRKPSKSITWQKQSATKKSTAIRSLSTQTRTGYCSAISSNKNPKISVSITLIDILKWLGFYCVIMDEKKARFVLLRAFGAKECPPYRMTNLLELSQFMLAKGDIFSFQDVSVKWKQKCQKIEFLVSFPKHAGKKEKELFNTIAIPISNKRYPQKTASLKCYKLPRSLKMFEILELNASLEKYYFYVLSARYTLYSDPDSCEYDTDEEEDFQWETKATIYNLCDPQPLYQSQYSLGDFSETKMKNIRNRDVSNVIPRSRYLHDKLNTGSGIKTRKKRAISSLSISKRNRNWDSSSEDEQERINGSSGCVTKSAFCDFNADFYDVEPMELNSNEKQNEELILPIHIPEGEKEFEDSDIMLMLATDTPLPKRFIENAAIETQIQIFPQMDLTLINAMVNENDAICFSSQCNAENEKGQKTLTCSIPSESEMAKSERRGLRFKLSPVSKTKTQILIKKPYLPKSYIKKKSKRNIGKLFNSNIFNAITKNFKTTLASLKTAKRIKFVIQSETEAEKQVNKNKWAAEIKAFENELKKPFIKKMKELKIEIRKSYGLPDKDYVERHHDTRWRPVAADIDETQFQDFLAHLEYNWYWYWNGFQKLKTFQNAFLRSKYSILRHNKKIETEKAIQESRSKIRNRRRCSLDAVQLRFSYSVILGDKCDDNIEKTPFEHYYDQEYCLPPPQQDGEEGLKATSTLCPKIRNIQRSSSLPRNY